MSDLSIQMAALNTKMSVIVWIGTAIGGLLVAQLFNAIAKERKSSDSDEPTRLLRRYRISPSELDYILRTMEKEAKFPRVRAGPSEPST